MDARQFISYLGQPSSVSAETLRMLEEVVRQFPFCQSAQILYAFTLYRENHPQFAAQLKQAAIYAADRRVLKRLIDGYRITQSKTEKPLPSQPEQIKPVTRPPEVVYKPVVPVKPKEPASAPKEVLSDGSETSREVLLAIVRKRLAEIEEERKAMAGSQTVPAEVKFQVRSIEPADQGRRFLSKEELIEKFIREEPKISSPRTVLIKPTEHPARSQAEDDEIVSETLAILYFKQGYVDRARRIYDKLCLLFPEKSSYFAGRMTELLTSQQSSNTY